MVFNHGADRTLRASLPGTGQDNIDMSSLKDRTHCSLRGEPSANFGQYYLVLLCYRESHATSTLGEALLDIRLMLNLHTQPGAAPAL